MALEAIQNTGNKTTSSYNTGGVTIPETTSVEDVSTVSLNVEQTQGSEGLQNYETQETVEAAEQKNVAPSEGTIKQAISDINKKINPNTFAQFGIHDKTNRVTIKIVDKDTDEIIREFPAEETLDMIAKVWELAGMFVDEKG